MDSQITATELRPVRIPTLAEARLLVSALKLPRQLPANATFEYADWFLGPDGGWESIAVRYRLDAGWLRLHQVEPTTAESLRSYAPAVRTMTTGRIVLTATLRGGVHLVEWSDGEGRRVHLTSDVLSEDELTVIAESAP